MSSSRASSEHDVTSDSSDSSDEDSSSESSSAAEPGGAGSSEPPAPGTALDVVNDVTANAHVDNERRSVSHSLNDDVTGLRVTSDTTSEEQEEQKQAEVKGGCIY